MNFLNHGHQPAGERRGLQLRRYELLRGPPDRLQRRRHGVRSRSLAQEHGRAGAGHPRRRPASEAGRDHRHPGRQRRTPAAGLPHRQAGGQGARRPARRERPPGATGHPRTTARPPGAAPEGRLLRDGARRGPRRELPRPGDPEVREVSGWLSALGPWPLVLHLFPLPFAPFYLFPFPFPCFYSTSASASPALTAVPATTRTFRTTPFLGERISFCIFIASTTTTPSPASTGAPSALRTRTTLPGMGDTSRMSPAPASAAERRPRKALGSRTSAA